MSWEERLGGSGLEARWLRAPSVLSSPGPMLAPSCTGGFRRDNRKKNLYTEGGEMLEEAS